MPKHPVKPEGATTMDKLVRIGVIYPTGGSDYEYYQFAEAAGSHLRICLVTTRLYGGDQEHELEALLKTGDIALLETTARKLAHLNVDAAMWACTSGSFAGGVKWAQSQIKALSAGAGCPAGSTSLAFVHALDYLRLKNVAVMATYPEAISDLFVRFLEDKGIKVHHSSCLDELSGWDAALRSTEEIVASICQSDRQQADAIVVPDTALPTLSLIETVENRIGKPVLTANQVTLWEGMMLAGCLERLTGWGVLFDDDPDSRGEEV